MLSGDRLVASNSQSQQWGSVQDVTLTLTYPRFGTGAIVSYVDISVNQVCYRFIVSATFSNTFYLFLKHRAVI